MADVVHLAAPGHEQGPFVVRGVRYDVWQLHLADGRSVWLIYGPPELSNCPSGGSPSGSVIAPPEFQGLRPP